MSLGEGGYFVDKFVVFGELEAIAAFRLWSSATVGADERAEGELRFIRLMSVALSVSGSRVEAAGGLAGSGAGSIVGAVGGAAGAVGGSGGWFMDMAGANGSAVMRSMVFSL